ncbi:MAG: SDR family NAD(P)-dependent oxidoreductase [Marmoricola sp.]
MTRSVLITGASTGIGRATARRLATGGWTVFAGVRDERSAAELRDEGLIPVLLDVTDAASIRSAVDQVASSVGASLNGLFNNAGVPSVGPVEFLPLDDLRRTLEVNLVGQVAVTQAFLPLVRQASGRIVFTSSLSGRVAAPFLSGYAASKHALEAVADSLRREVGTGIRVALIEPGNISTPIWDKGLDPRIRGSLPPEAELLYGRGLDFAQAQGERAARTAIDPGRVARAVERALTSRRPRRRSVVGPAARLMIPLARGAPGLLDQLIAAGIRHQSRSAARAPGTDLRTPARKDT